jgi:UDP-glucose:(heptosyl)LPS alpha-1,3-glucosyltransferase
MAADKIRVIYNGLDRVRFRPRPAPERDALAARLDAPHDSGIVLFVGSGFRRKGLAWLLEAFGQVADPKARLWVVGRDRSRRHERLAQRLGVGERVRFWGAQADPAPFYQAAAVLALPTLYDPCSNVVLEALGCGTPVITTDANGAAQFLIPGVNGAILARPDDVAGLTRFLDDFLARRHDPAVRDAAAGAVAGLSWEATVRQTLAVLEEAAGGG